MGGTIDCQQYLFSFPRFLCLDDSSITADHLIAVFIKIVKRRFLTGMWKPDILHCTVIISCLCHRSFKLFCKLPVIIQINTF